MRDLIEDGHGGKMYLEIKAKADARYNELEAEYEQNIENVQNPDELAPLENNIRQLSDITVVTTVNTVRGRLNEIIKTEAGSLSDKLSGAVEAEDVKAAGKLTETYKKLLAEVIALNAAKERNGENSDIDWKSIERQIAGRNGNQMFVNMTANLTPQKVTDDLEYLKEHSVSEFLTYKAEQLNLANNQAAQAENGQAQVQNVQQIQHAGPNN